MIQSATLITNSVPRMETAIHDATRLVVEKIEGDKLEELLSRTRNLSMLVKLGKADQALQYAMTLRESVDYARNRVHEDKLYWLGPYIGGYAVFLAALEYSGSSSEPQVEEFKELVQKSKIEILDAAAPTLLTANRSLPWLEIALFLANETDRLPEAIISVFKQPEPTSIVQAETDITSRSKVAVAAKVCLDGKTGVYFAPQIPQRKLEGAKRKLLQCSEPSDRLIALIDTTMFGGCADGVAIFEEYIVYTDIGEDAHRYSYNELQVPPPMAVGSDIKAGGKIIKMYNQEVAGAFAAFLLQTR